MSGLFTKNCLYINEKGVWCDDDEQECPKIGEIIRHRLNKTYFDVWLYYANLIDYLRILMTLVALALIFHNKTIEDPMINYTITSLILGSVVLDAVDGKVARYFGQSTVMGCGWDWLADILAQYSLAIWCLVSTNAHSGITLFTVFFTLVEIACGLFDFAISAQSVYPTMKDTSSLPWYARVEHLLTPNHSYNLLGWITWLSNT